MGQRVGHRIRPGAASVAVAVGTLLVAMVSTALGTTYINLTTAGASGATTNGVNGAVGDGVFIQGGIGSGTGNFNPFMTMNTQGEKDLESGVNSCVDNPNAVGCKDNTYNTFYGGSRTKAIQVAGIPSIAYNGQSYRQFTLDASDTGSDDYMSLDQLKIFIDDQADLHEYDSVTEAFADNTGIAPVKVYDMGDTRVLMRTQTLTPGNGVSDITLLVHDSAFPANCFYGSTECNRWLYFWNANGGVGAHTDGHNYNVTAGFEEWRVSLRPVVNVTKTAVPTFNRTYDWSVDKTVSPTTLDLFDGDSAAVTWSVTPTRGAPQDSNWRVSGTITVTNPTGSDPIPTKISATVNSVMDVIDASINVNSLGTVTCPSFPATLAAGASLQCTYSYTYGSAPAAGSHTNVATANINVTAIETGNYSGSRDFDFADATPTATDATANLTDSRGPLNQAAVSGQEVTYEEEFACGANEGTHDNTARVTEDDSGAYDEDSASVTVNCYDLSVSKTADESRTRTYEWDIDKSVDPESWSLFDGDTGTSDYLVTITKTGYTDSDWHVEGDITIHNNHPTLDADLTGVTDEIFDGIAADVDCPPLTVPAGDDLVCTYSADLLDGTTRLNTATATQQNYDYDADGVPAEGGTTDYDGTASVNFSDAETNEVNASVNVTDTYEGDLGTFSDSDTASYDRAFDCSEVEYTDGHASYTADNTATIDETGQDASASVAVDCYILDVTKDADESFDRTYDWSIDKSADQEELNLAPNQQFEVNYSVTVDVTGYTDDNFDVTGEITITNPNPDRDADLTDVVDEIFSGIAADVDCPSMTVPAGDSLVCTYESQDLPDGSTRNNTATATQQNYDFDSDGVGTESGTTDYDGSASVDFSGAAVNEIDECVDVNDTIAGFLGTVCVDDAPPPPTTFDYSEFVGPYSEAECGEHDVPNTADFLTNDNGATGEASWNVHITVPCPEGCTLTQGYWKTHSEYGPAPEDPNWYLIGDFDADGTSEGPDEDFFGTGQTWYEVFWTPVTGRPYYQLAHQWMAAYLNALSIEDLGGTIPASVQTGLSHGADLLDTWDGQKDLKGKNAKVIRADFVATAGILADFNEGDIGPGHCDEDGTSAPALFLPIGLLAPIASRLRRRAR